jgi:hypothetical protein
VYDFLLFVHMLFAFGLVAAVTTFWALTLATRPQHMSLTPAAAMLMGRVGAIVVGISSLGVLVFGVWLAIYLDAYHPWDGWVLGSIVLWIIATGTGQQSGRLYERAATGAGDAPTLRRTGLQLQVIATAAILLILVLMIFKPGA